MSRNPFAHELHMTDQEMSGADDEAKGHKQPRQWRHELPPGECAACDRDRGQFHPSHDASPNCQSGKHPHCTCDTCF